MARYIGLDVHTQTSTAVVLGASGRKLREQVLETSARVLVDFVRSIDRPRYLCMEEGTQSAWLYETLEPIVDKLVVVQPSKSKGSKSDSRDAYARANDLRVGNIEGQVFKAPNAHQQLREAVQAYRIVQRDLVRVKLRLHAVGRSRGLAEVASQLYDPNDRHDVLARLPEHTARKTKLWCDELDGLVDRFEEAESWVHDVASQTPIVKRLSTAPGIGLIRASQIVAIVVSPHRFRTKRQFWSYCGLGVVTHSSADWMSGHKGFQRAKPPQTRGLNHNRHPVMKDVFKGAAMTALRCAKHPVTDRYEHLIEHGTKPNMAVLSIARHIAAAVLAMWKNNEDYDPDRDQR